MPTLYIESDLIDPRYWSVAQIKNRVDAFFEVLEQRAALRRDLGEPCDALARRAGVGIDAGQPRNDAAAQQLQPRRAMPGRGWLNDFLAPSPGFSRAQYDRLALVYIVASRRV